MNRAHLIGVGLVCLLLGVGLGYTLSRLAAPTETVAPETMTHTMSDGNTMTGSMDHAMESMTAGLTGKTGEEFDQAFLNEMIIHHQGAVDMAKMVLEQSQRAELRQLANDIIAAQTKEIGMMEAWRTAWFQ